MTREAELRKEIERKDYLRNYSKKWRKENNERIKAYSRDYYKKNRKRMRLYQNKVAQLDKYKQMKRKSYAKAKKEGRTNNWYAKFIKKHGSIYFAQKKSPFYQAVVLETNHKFKRDSECSLCGCKERLQFHHWIYKLPVERKHFSTLCRDCHIMIHGRTFNEKG